jgi:tetratricopeptide (TPR) repeat protein
MPRRCLAQNPPKNTKPHVWLPLLRPLAATACLALSLGTAEAQTKAPPRNPHPTLTKPAPAPAAPASAPTGPVENSAMDAQLFYQILVSEVRLRQDDAGFAYQVYLEAAKHHVSAQLFQRSVDVALAARAGEQALTAARAWRVALPADRQAAEYEAQILMALGKTEELAAPLESLIKLASDGQRSQVIASLPRSLSRLTDKRATARLIDTITQSWREASPPMAEAWAASSEGWLGAGDYPLAYERLQRSLAINPNLLTGGLLALDLMAQRPDAENIVKTQLTSQPSLVLRLAYARKLAASQRMAEAATQLESIVSAQPDNAAAWLTLGTVRIEMRQLDPAELAIRKFLTIQSKVTSIPDGTQPMFDVDQGYLRMAQISELRKQWAQADEWLRKSDPKGSNLTVQISRARILVAQGKLADARALIRAIPETEPRDALVKINAEAQLLRDANQLEDALKLLSDASERFPDDGDLLYDQAMVADSLKRYEESERLLRRVMTLAPEQANAFNALGYSLADRGVRLDEARELIKKALALRPGDPFITDSLGWLEYRAGKADEALKWLRQAYVSRPDTEIAAHLGEVLWSTGQKDEATRIWREGQTRDPANETLKETLKRLRVRM